MEAALIGFGRDMWVEKMIKILVTILSLLNVYRQLDIQQKTKMYVPTPITSCRS